MNMKKLTPDLVGNSIQVQAPSHTSKDLGRRSGPATGMSMTLPISEIDFFDRNPRRIHDPEEFSRLKESIREIGVQQPVHVTTPPGSSRYMLAKGGNSRLLCLQELLSETGDERYSKIPAIYIEYTSEEDILIAHLIENEQRAEMLFWDKACAYAEMRDLFEETSGEALGVRPLAKQFVNKGLTVSFAKLSVYLFAADNLAALGNLCNSLSIQKATDLRKFYNELQTAYKESGKLDEALKSFWDDSLENWTNAHADSDDLDVAALQKSIQQSFAETFDIAPKSKELAENDHSKQAPTSNNEDESAVNSQAAAKKPSETAPTSPTELSGNDLLEDSDGDDQSDSVSRQPVNPADGAIMSNDQSNTAKGMPSDITLPRTREQVMADICHAVKDLMACVKIDQLLIEDPQMPYGWMLDFPDFTRPGWDQSDAELVAMINVRHDLAATVFIYLWTVSGQKALWENPQLLRTYNPFTNKPQSIIQTIYPDDALRQEAETLGIAMDAYTDSVTEVMFEFVLRDPAARQAYVDHIRYTAELEQMDGDNWFKFQEKL